MKPSKSFYNYLQNSIKFVIESSLLLWTIIFVVLLFVSRNCYGQIDFAKIPATQQFINNGVSITVKNIPLKQYDKELKCTWLTSHAQISGLMDVKNQDFINDWLSGLSYFGNCEGDKECYDFQSYHYYYKVTRVSFIRNDLLSFYLHEGNCKSVGDSCIENQDWEIYDLRSKHFLSEKDIFRQDKQTQKELFESIENKVKKEKYRLVNDWRAYTRQIGLAGNNVVIYLNNDIFNNNKGISLRFDLSEIDKFLEPCFSRRLHSKNCDTATKILTSIVK